MMRNAVSKPEILEKAKKSEENQVIANSVTAFVQYTCSSPHIPQINRSWKENEKKKKNKTKRKEEGSWKNGGKNEPMIIKIISMTMPSLPSRTGIEK
ncbi:hypothetical protein I7I48_04389 [Histoplasma ohiense]|nr:hypothetical protein I7I48_04389 [Histoplasma ohiense (nom. inval.)]